MTSEPDSTAPTIPAIDLPPTVGRRRTGGLGALASAFGTAGALLALTYVVPGLAPYRPWVAGDPIPLVDALIPRGAPRVVEDEKGELVAAGPTEDPAKAPDTAPLAPVPVPDGVDPATLPERPPGVRTPLVDAGNKGMAPFYRALHRVANGAGIARATHWGDSTIAADGITSTVRQRLQARFGDGGPGYLNVGMDPRWNTRADVPVSREGTWDTKSILNGGASGKYGLGGVVATGSDGASVSFSAPARDKSSRVLQHHVEVWYQAAPGGGKWSASASGKGVGAGSAAADAPVDRFVSKDFPDGITRVTLKATEGSATFYGVVMETKGPGVTWDALGVVGVGSHSFGHTARGHISAQVARRKPDLIVVQLGGNELGGSVLKGDGSGYGPYFSGAFDKLRAGAPNAGCLIVTPLDQGTRKGASVTTKPLLNTLIKQQRALAAAKGCAFWDAQGAMGGEGSIGRWSAHKPRLAWSDLLHLSEAGHAIVGNLLADAIIAGYDQWAKGPEAREVEAAVAAERAAAPTKPAAAPAKESKPKAASKPSGTKKSNKSSKKKSKKRKGSKPAAGEAAPTVQGAE
jgi:lysophospholipase L1-like esterase